MLVFSSVNPISALKDYIDKEVDIVLKDGSLCNGMLLEVDDFMDVVLQDYRESENGKIHNSKLMVRGTLVSIIRLR